MPTNSAKTRAKAKRGRRSVARPRSAKVSPKRKQTAKAPTNSRGGSKGPKHPYVFDAEGATYVLVPVEDYEQLVKADMVQHAIAQIEKGDNDFVDADDVALELAAERIARARKAAGLTQKQLGQKLKLPQSQISRIERNPDHTTVRTLKRIARALGVDLRALV